MEIRNLSMPLANTEYSITFPPEVSWVTMQARGSNIVRFATLPGKVAGSVAPYATLKSSFDTGPETRVPLKPGTSTTIYFASSDSNVVVETWERY